MKRTILIVLLSLFSNIHAQTENPEYLIQPDLVIGEYGISLKDKTIGRYHIFDCSTAERYADCHGYLKANDITFDTTSLVFIGEQFRFKEDLILDLNTIEILDSGNTSKRYSEKRTPIYIDKNRGYKSLDKNGVIDSLYGYTHLEKRFFIKKDTLGYLDVHGFYTLNNSQNIDKDSFKAIAKNVFYDKNGIYYVEYGRSETKEKKYSDIVTLQELDTAQKPTIAVKEHYLVINGKVYDINRVENELKLNPKKIKELVLQDYYGEMLLFDDTNAYNKKYTDDPFYEASCETEFDKTELYCLFNDLNDIETIRKTGFIEYHLDVEKKILYFDANKNLALTETSGNLFKVGSAYYFTDFDRFSIRLSAVKIWNTIIDDYEDLDLEHYRYLHDEIYYYKGNLYGNHSEIKQKNFNLKNARALVCNRYVYVLNDELIVDFEHENILNLSSIQVLKNNDNNATDYLIGSDFLIYDNQVIEDIETKNITVLNSDILKTETHFITNGVKMKLTTFPFKIKLIK